MTDRLPFHIECSGGWKTAAQDKAFKVHSFSKLYPEIDFEYGSSTAAWVAETLEEIAALVPSSMGPICTQLAVFVSTGYLGDDLSRDLLLPLTVPNGPLEGMGAFSSPAHVLAAHDRFRRLNVTGLMEAYNALYPERISPEPNYYKNPVECTVYEFASVPFDAAVYTCEAWDIHNDEQPEAEFEAFYMRAAQWLFLVESACDNQRGICFASM